VSDRLLIAYGLMFLLAVGFGAVIWWNVYHSHRRTYRRRLARERKQAAAAEQGRSVPWVDGRDRA
jgi:hypothetical protein